jgi:hypothetical protein
MWKGTRKVQREKFTSGAERWNLLTAHTQHVAEATREAAMWSYCALRLTLENFVLVFLFVEKILSLSRQSRLFSLILTFDET